MLELTDVNFTAETSSGVVVVDFWASWCMPCRALVPVLNSLDSEFKGRAKICKAECDQCEEIIKKENISALPTIAFYKNGECVKKMVGVQGFDKYVEVINSLLD